MSRLAPAIRLRRRQLDTLALKLAAEQAAATGLGQERDRLAANRAAERHHAALLPLAADRWFAAAGSRLAALSAARAEAEARLQALRHDTVEARARLQLLEDAAMAADKADRRKALRRAEVALDDRTAAGWSRR